MTRRLLALALASAISPSLWAQHSSAPSAVVSPAEFTVSDIRVDGLQRIGAGTLFTYLSIA